MWTKLTGKLAGAALTGRALWVVMGLVLAGASWATFSFFHIASLNKQIGECAAFEQTAELSAQAVTMLAERVTRCVNERALDIEFERRANARLEAKIQAMNIEIARERRERDVLYETDDECAVWRSNFACAAISERLRHSAATLASPYRGSDTGDDPNP